MNTRLAALERISDGLLLVRFDAGVKIDRPGLLETIRARCGMPGEHPFPVLVTIPEDADFDPGIMRMDHFADEQARSRVSLLAIASDSTMLRSLAQIYFAYFPQDFPVRVFATIQEAMIWVDEQPGGRPATKAPSAHFPGPMNPSSPPLTSNP